MAKQLNVSVQKDHFETLSNVSGNTALMELIWNALDADATEIKVVRNGNALQTDSIEISDNGHGVNYEDALEAFEKLGGSLKKTKKYSPQNRAFHGKEGKGRYNSFGLGDLNTFKSIYNEKGVFKSFDITLDRNDLNKPSVSDVVILTGAKSTGFRVKIQNIHQKKSNLIFSEDTLKSLEQKLALYYQQYPNFTISIDNKFLDFKSQIVNEYNDNIEIYSGIEGTESKFDFKLRILEWGCKCESKIYLCSENSINYLDTKIGVRTNGLNLSVYLSSDYIEKLHSQNQLNIAEYDTIMSQAIEDTKKITKKYILDRLHHRGVDFIKELKENNIYPYIHPAKDEVEYATRQVFDIVALNINEYVPNFSTQANSSKKLTLTLIKEALENDATALKNILFEVINLPANKISDLNDLIENSSLSAVIDTMTEVTNRLRLLYELKIVVMDPLKNKKVLERKHLHKIIEKETWIFGDEYALGASDANLKNVLKSHLKELGRVDFESIVEEGDNTNLNEIPDVCLFKQHNNGKHGHFRNLVIELKRPTVDAGIDEFNQITKYSQKVSDDSRFEKDKTEWTFILLVNDIKPEIRNLCQQHNRKFGHIIEQENINVYIVKWGALFNEAEARHQYLKEKLNFNIKENQEGLDLLNSKYEEYLPGVLQTSIKASNPLIKVKKRVAKKTVK